MNLATNKIIKIITLVFFLVVSSNLASSKENFFDEALKMYQDKEYDDARFLLERNIVFNPKDAKSYLYLAKIYNHEENQRKEEYNLDTALLIEPNNEEAILMLMKTTILTLKLINTAFIERYLPNIILAIQTEHKKNEK